MSKAIVILGTFVFAALMYAVPVLTTCALLLHWDGFITLMLCMVTFVQFILAVSIAYANFDGGDGDE